MPNVIDLHSNQINKPSNDNHITLRQSENVDAGLKIIIVGGGIGGLSAAIALRRQGHDVHVYESSGFSKEVGAAINTAPNANGILKGLGISCKDIGACVCESMSEWNYDGVKIKKLDLVTPNKIWEHKYRLAHRIALHDALRKAAVATDGIGPPAKLNLSMPVKDVDASNGVVYFKDGTSMQGDVVIGADGIHSVTRTKLPGGDIQPFPSGVSAFRFLIPRESVLSDPRTKKFAQDDGDFIGLLGPDRNIIIYPTSNNTILNFACFHPDDQSSSSLGWGTSATRAQLLEIFKEFHPDIIALLEKADEDSLKVWKILDMKQLPTWHHGRLAIIGDAAHPFMPFLGQGGAIAIEDAVSLGVVLERGLGKDEVMERLQLYQQIRKERAELIQEYTRISGRSRGEKKSLNATPYFAYCFKHDEWHNSAQKLREWKWAKLAKTAHPMTTVFGPPLSVPKGSDGSLVSQSNPTFVTASIKFNTSRTILDGLLPPGDKAFQFRSPATVAQCTLRQTTFKGLPSLGGRGYSRLGLYIHGVEYRETEGEPVNGAFLPIMFENMADTIINGIAQLGIPKVWSTIDVEQDDKSYNIRTGWEGLAWGNFVLEDLELVDRKDSDIGTAAALDSSQGDRGTLLHQYISSADGQQSQRTIFLADDAKENVNGAGTAGKSADVNNASAPRPERVWRAKSAYFKLDAREPEDFPTLYHIISRLQDIPVLSVIEATLIEGSGIPNIV